MFCAARTRRRSGNETTIELSTYGIGRELKREAWQAIGRELLRLGLIECAPGKFATLSLTPAGRDALRHRTPITLTKQIEVVAQDQKARAGAIECDEVLFERLRGLRRGLADERNVPSYVIFSDVSLREMAKNYPTTATEFRRNSQAWASKSRRILPRRSLDEIKNYLAANPRRTFSSDLERRRPPRRTRLNDSQRETLRRFQSGESVDDISRARGFVRSTVYDHLEAAIKLGESLKPDRFFTAAQREEIASAFRKVSRRKTRRCKVIARRHLRLWRTAHLPRAKRALTINVVCDRLRLSCKRTT